MDDAKTSPKIEVFYDGLCKVCDYEISHYRKQVGAEGISFKDITAPDFNAAHEGVDPQKIHKIMHVKLADGSLVLGPEAFRVIWRALPKYRWAFRLTDNSPSRMLMRFGYEAFLVIRPYLPRKQADCGSSPYCENHTNSSKN